jgi:transcriptional repressor NrdR
MKCVYCEGETNVVNSRPQIRNNGVWRRRKCQNCMAVFTTVESIDYEKSVVFSGYEGHLQPFSRDKLFQSVYDSCKHRKDALEVSIELTGTIISKLMKQSDQALIQRAQVLDITSNVLANFDKAALID